MLLLLLAATQIDQLYGRVGSGNWILDGVTFAIAHTASNSSSMKKCTCVCVCVGALQFYPNRIKSK